VAETFLDGTGSGAGEIKIEPKVILRDSLNNP